MCAYLCMHNKQTQYTQILCKQKLLFWTWLFITHFVSILLNILIILWRDLGKANQAAHKKNANPPALLLCFCTSDFKCGLISVSNILKRAPMHAEARLIDVILFLCFVYSSPFNWQSCGLLWSGVLKATTRRQILCRGIITFSNKV